MKGKLHNIDRGHFIKQILYGGVDTAAAGKCFLSAFAPGFFGNC